MITAGRRNRKSRDEIHWEI